MCREVNQLLKSWDLMYLRLLIRVQQGLFGALRPINAMTKIRSKQDIKLELGIDHMLELAHNLRDWNFERLSGT